MGRYGSWDDFCNDVFSECGKSGRALQMLYGAGGMVLIMIVVSMLGFSPFMFITWLLGFLITPPGMIVAAVFGGAAVFVMKELFSERARLRPILQRLVEAKSMYERIIAAHPDPNSSERRRLIDQLLTWVVSGTGRPDIGPGPDAGGESTEPEGPTPVPA
jgi:hypothetical protein